jgi:tyrosyl-tRNA synthetase
MDLLRDLEFRGLLNQATDEEELAKRLTEGRISVYCGFDPTADSLHIGNLVSVLTLKRFQLMGHRPIALVGGATGLIGDPSGKANERTLNTQEVVENWSEKIRYQLSRFLDFEAEENAAKVVNNYDWLGGMDLITFLRDVGKNFSLNYMLAKDSVDSRLATGISFTEFSYMILQSIDFLELYRKENCRLQIGGSDQWGNITAGLELIRRSGEEDRAFGLTTPLVTKSDGTKFGKTESGTIWLDPQRTSPYEFYQFWINTDDRDVVSFLKYFTFLSPEEIASLEEQVNTAPEKRAAQQALAREVTTIVHGEAALQQAVRISEALFSGELGALTAEEIEQGFKDVPSHTLSSKDDIGLLDLLLESGVASSKRQALR